MLTSVVKEMFEFHNYLLLIIFGTSQVLFSRHNIINTDRTCIKVIHCRKFLRNLGSNKTKQEW